MPSNFTPGVKIIGVPGPKGDPGPPGTGGEGGGPHEHPEYVHTHPYATDPHSHPEYVHDHPYSATGHTHAYADVVHAHDYADEGHTHDTTHTHTAAEVGAATSGHTHDTTHAHDGVYAPVHGHPYADASHGIHPDSTTWTDLTDGGQTSLHTHAGSGSHPDLAAHDSLGLATQAELDAVAGAKANTSHSHVDADIPATIARDTEVATAVTNHEGAANPHPTYETSAEVDAKIATHLSTATHGGGGGSSDTVVVVGTDVPNTSNTTAVTAISAPNIAAGTYLFKVWIAWKTAATTTGIEMWANHTGTVTRFVSTWYTLTTGGAAATGVADQATTLTAQMLEGKAQRVKDTASGPIQGTDTANADQFAVMEGVMIVTATGTFEFKFRSEINASAATILAGTTLELRKVA